MCRFNFPFRECPETSIEIVDAEITADPTTPLSSRPEGGEMGSEAPAAYDSNNCLPEDGPIFKSTKIEYETKRSLHSMYIGKHSSAVLQTYGNNGNVQLIGNPEISLYVSNYTSKKSSTESRAALTGCVQMVSRRLERLKQKQLALARKNGANDNRSDSSPVAEKTAEEKRKEVFALGLGNLHAGWKGLSGSTLVGAQLAHFYGLGYGSHMFSHKFVNAAVPAIADLIDGKPVRSVVTLLKQTGTMHRRRCRSSRQPPQASSPRIVAIMHHASSSS